MTLGFFGQYRREKDPRPLIEAFLNGTCTRPAALLIQGATQTAEDARDFEALIASYRDPPNLRFLHEPLVGRAWQEALAQVDAIVIPYGNERYRYHTSALISNAMGFQKPVLVADNVTPEILGHYEIG